MKVRKVLILSGLPASGKSTKAKELVDKGGWKRCNKDLIRLMLDNSKWSRNNEKFVLALRDHIILTSLQDGYNVVVDDTNMGGIHQKHIKELVKDLQNVVVEEEFINTPLEVCISRDAARDEPVGKKVIMDMYNKYLRKEQELIPYEEGLPEAINVDIDGTLAHFHNRSPYDWSRVGEDTLDESVASIVKIMYNHVHVIIMSGRDSICRAKTEAWLAHNGIYYNALYMRPEGNTEKDSVIKERLYNNHIKGSYNVRFVLDDRQQVVDTWRRLGLKCFQVAEGNF